MNPVNTPRPKREAHAKDNGPAHSYSAKQRVFLSILPPLATLLIRVLCLTLRFETIAETGAHPADENANADIYAFWHRCLLLAAYRYRGLGIRILISQSFDGELIARIVQRLSFVPVRGSSSRGGAAGLLALSRALEAEHKIALTVDGPKGPSYVAKPGAASIAIRQAKYKEHIPAQTISPFHLHASRCWTLRSWDHFVIPKPFSRVTCAWVSPVLVADDASLTPVNAELQLALDHAVQLAEAS